MGDRKFELHSEHDDEPDGWDWWWLFHDDYRRPCGSSVEGTSEEWLAIARAIKLRSSVSFKRCAVRTLLMHDGSKPLTFEFWSPRNCAGERDKAVLSQSEGEALAAWIEEHVKVRPPAAEPGAGREESTTSSAGTDPAPGEPLDTIAGLRECAAGWDPQARLLGNWKAGDIVRACDAIMSGTAGAVHLAESNLRLREKIERMGAEITRCRELLLLQTRAGLGRFVLGEIDVKAGRCCILVTDDDEEETIAQGVVAHLIPMLRAQGLRVDRTHDAGAGPLHRDRLGRLRRAHAERPRLSTAVGPLHGVHRAARSPKGNAA